MYVRLVLQPGCNDMYSDNDLVLLCKDNPEVRKGQALYEVRMGQALSEIRKGQALS